LVLPLTTQGGETMLAFTVKEGETFLVGNARIKVVKIRGKQIRISVEAPLDVPVVRESLIAGKE
jgi:sRNA-binding carbon storage regulator CsrA